MPLQSIPFSSSSRLVEIEKGGRIMVRGEHGLATGLVQAGLVDLGFKLPFSTRPDGHLDGVFGKETEAAVRKFQHKHGLRMDGKVGVKTIRQIDAALVAKTPPSPPPPPPPPPVVSGYQLGTGDPPLHHDAGAGTWGSTPKTARMLTLKGAFLVGWRALYEFAWPDATLNLRHYLDNEGKVGWIDLDKMIREVPSAKRALANEVGRAKTFAETLPPGTYDITSTVTRGGYDWLGENKNWFFAVGGYTRWGKGHLLVTDRAGRKHYELFFDYKFYDRYNWDDGKSVDIPMSRSLAWIAQHAGFEPGKNPAVGDPDHSIHVTDQLMGEFQREGLAKEYDYYGLARRRFEWDDGEAIPAVQIF